MVQSRVQVLESPILYSSKFLWHNIFMNFVINLNITKILFTKFECEFRMQTEEVGSKKLVIGDARDSNISAT